MFIRFNFLRTGTSGELLWTRRCLSSRMLRRNDGSSKHLWNVGKFLRGYMAQLPRWQSPSYSPQWETEISLVNDMSWGKSWPTKRLSASHKRLCSLESLYSGSNSYIYILCLNFQQSDIVIPPTSLTRAHLLYVIWFNTFTYFREQVIKFILISCRVVF
jgi:hypothetical protein